MGMQDGSARFPSKHAQGTAVAERGSEGGAKEMRCCCTLSLMAALVLMITLMLMLMLIIIMVQMPPLLATRNAHATVALRQALQRPTSLS